jgi:hypothetical protein
MNEVNKLDSQAMREIFNNARDNYNEANLNDKVGFCKQVAENFKEFQISYVQRLINKSEEIRADDIRRDLYILKNDMENFKNES